MNTKSFSEQVYEVLNSEYGLHSPEAEKMMQNIIESSKFAFMQGDDVRLFGHFEEWQGCYFSNLRFAYYLPRVHPFSF